MCNYFLILKVFRTCSLNLSLSALQPRGTTQQDSHLKVCQSNRSLGAVILSQNVRNSLKVYTVQEAIMSLETKENFFFFSDVTSQNLSVQTVS